VSFPNALFSEVARKTKTTTNNNLEAINIQCTVGNRHFLSFLVVKVCQGRFRTFQRLLHPWSKSSSKTIAAIMALGELSQKNHD
jgi:hypothetical protein